MQRSRSFRARKEIIVIGAGYGTFTFSELYSVCYQSANVAK